MINNKTVGRRIAGLRQNSGLTQQQLAAQMCVSHQAVSKWESGQALPDIQTMLELTRFFGITVEQLTADESELEIQDAPNTTEETVQETYANSDTDEKKEGNKMTIQQLLQMAPYMSRETVEEIAMEMEGPMSAQQIARIAPHVRPECVEKLVEKHKPELSWDSLRRIAPFMRKEAVDELARAIASGRETVKPVSENINKTINDIGKAFDDIGKGMEQAFDDIGKGVEHAVKKAIRFGENVINDVSAAFSDKSQDKRPAARSVRAAELRRKAFERALADEKWDWIALHLDDIREDEEFMAQIAARAGELEMHDWIRANMSAYAADYSVETAIAEGNWEWLGEKAADFSEEVQEQIALAAMEAENWQWLGCHSDGMKLENCALAIASAARNKGAYDLSVQIARNHLNGEQCVELANEAFADADFETVDRMIALVDDECLSGMLVELGRQGNWEMVMRYITPANIQTVEQLLEIAVEQGNFDAIDFLDQYL